jgi:transcription elongation factor Elf1
MKAFVCDHCGSTKSVHVPANRDEVAGRECYDCGRGFIQDEPKNRTVRRSAADMAGTVAESYVREPSMADFA